MQLNNNSPFQQTNLIAIEESYSYEATLFGLRMPSGKVVINFDHRTKYSVLKDIARITSSEVVQVKGTWTFEPAVDNSEIEDYNGDGV